MTDYRSVVVALKANVKAWVAGMTEAGASVTTLKGVAEEFAAGDYDPKIGVDDARARTALDVLKAELDQLDQETATPNVDLHGAGPAAAQIAALDAELEALDHKTATPNVRVTGTERASRQASFLVDVIATLGPAAVASSAVAAGAIGVFGASMLAAGGAGGILGIAVAGTVSQMKKQQQEITAATKALDGQTKGTAAYHQQLEKVNALQAQFNTQFGPAADSFARFQTTWHEFLADTADSSDSVIAKALDLASTILPKLEGIVASAGGSVSNLLDDLRHFAQGPEAAEMLAFFEKHGPVAIEAFGSAVGNIGKGFVSLLMAFAPMEDGILGGLQSLTAGFADWAAHVGETKGFQSFLAYIAQTGPRVLDALGAIAGALLAVLKAAAPIGSITLPIITELARILAVIANSPAGPELVGIALALAAVNRALRTMETIKASNVFLAIAGGADTAGNSVEAMSGGADTAGNSVEAMSKKAIAARVAVLGLGIGALLLSDRLDSSHQTIKDFAGAAGIGLIVGSINPALGVVAAFGVALHTAIEENGFKGSQAMDALNASLEKFGSLDPGSKGAANLVSTQQIALLSHIGISTRTYTQALLGNADAQGAVILAAEQLGPASMLVVQPIDDANAAANAAAANFSLLAGEVHKVPPAAVAAGKEIRVMGGAMSDTAGDLYKHATAAENAANGVNQLTDAEKRAREAVRQLTAALQDNEDALSHRQAMRDYADAIAAVDKAQKHGNVSIRQANVLLDAQAANANHVADTMVDGSKKQIAYLERARTSLYDQARQFGLTKEEARKYVDTVLDIPTEWKTKVDIDTKAAEAALKRAIALEQQLHDRTITIQYNIQQATGFTPGGKTVYTPAAGGYITGPGTATSDSIPAWLSNGEYVQKAAAVQKYGLGLMHAINSLSLPESFVRAMGYAGGGSVAQPRVTDSMTRAQPILMSVVFPGFAKEIAGLRAEIRELRTGTQNVHAVNAHEIATGVRSVAADEVAQDNAHWDTLAGMQVTG